MRDSEELAYRLYQTITPKDEQGEWDELNEQVQEDYLRMVTAAFIWLFDGPGRISQFITVEQLNEAQAIYAEHLRAEGTT